MDEIELYKQKLKQLEYELEVDQKKLQADKQNDILQTERDHLELIMRLLAQKESYKQDLKKLILEDQS